MFLLDANFLMIPAKFRIDIFKELEKFGKPDLYTISAVKKELIGLSKARGKNAVYAKLGLELIEKKKVKIIPSEKATDDEILRIANENSFIVCTQDKELRERALRKRIHVIVLRQNKYLDLI